MQIHRISLFGNFPEILEIASLKKKTLDGCASGQMTYVECDVQNIV